MNSDEQRKQFVQEQMLGRVDRFFDTLAERLQADVKKTTRSCVTCFHFDMKREVCKHEVAIAKDPDGLRPPAKVIAFGCGRHEYEIPF